MILGIVASTKIEADLIIGYLRKKRETLNSGKYFYKGILENKLDTVVCICGIGKSNAAHGTTLLLERFNPQLIYVIGIGGAYPDSGLNIGDIAIAEKEIYGDEGLLVKIQNIKEDFLSMERLNLPLATINGLTYYNEFPMFIPDRLREMISLHGSKAFDIKSKILIGNFVTVSTCTGMLKKAKEIRKRFNGICENMEGASIAHISLLYKVPVIEIRAISNIIKDREGVPINKSDIIDAAEIVQKFFLQIINEKYLT